MESDKVKEPWGIYQILTIIFVMGDRMAYELHFWEQEEMK